MRKIGLKFLKILIGIYVIFCVVLYFYQEKIIFLPEQLEKDYDFQYAENFEELNFKTPDGTVLNGLLFKADRPQGLIFYLHGNAGSLSSWGNVASTYTALNHDVFILDYRGYGKSQGSISAQQQLFDDNQIVYDQFREKYNENDITVLGYSIGTGLASKLASTNNPKRLILQAPYYSLTAMMRQRLWFVPTFILKYKFETNAYLQDCKMPIIIFHGEDDQVIPFDNARKLKNEFKSGIELIKLRGQGHNGMTENRMYKKALKRILEQL